jgi:hypothetical protein
MKKMFLNLKLTRHPIPEDSFSKNPNSVENQTASLISKILQKQEEIFKGSSKF